MSVKVIPIALQAHYDSNALSTAFLLNITRDDGAIYAFTSAFEDVKSEELGFGPGFTYKSEQGLIVAGLVNTAGFAVDNTELMTFDDGTVFTRRDVLGGLWRNAKFALYRYNWANPSDGVEVIMVGTLGLIRYADTTLVVELRGLQQFLQQPLGSVTSKTCRARFGDAKCRKSLVGLMFTATVTSVTSNQVFTASSLGQPEDYFGEGPLTWLTGANIGLAQKVKTHLAGGIITLSLSMFQQVAVGDTFVVVAGCRKRMLEDCYTKHNNTLNFLGENTIPGVDELAKSVK